MCRVFEFCFSTPLTVKRSSGPGVGDLVRGHDPGPERRVGVLTLREEPLAGAALVAGADVVDDRVTKNVFERVLRADACGRLADDDGELALPVQLFGQFRVVQDGLAGADDGGRGLGEQYRAGRQIPCRCRGCGWTPPRARRS